MHGLSRCEPQIFMECAEISDKIGDWLAIRVVIVDPQTAAHVEMAELHAFRSEPCSDSVDAQLAKMERKVAAGAEYFQTQAVFEPEKFIKFMEKAKQFGKPVQVGIIIPKSAGMAKFMNNNVAGIHVPDEMLEELKADKEKTKAGITGVEIAARIIKECKPYCQGVHIMALGWESKIPDLLKLAEI